MHLAQPTTPHKAHKLKFTSGGSNVRLKISVLKDSRRVFKQSYKTHTFALIEFRQHRC
jgi:hypothetical protein